MKRLNSLLMMLLIGITGLCTLTSCEDDAQDVAYTLEGSWTGTISTYFQDRWGWSGDDYRVTFTFIRNGDYNYNAATSGRGIETGYNVNNKHDYYRNTFSWYVEDNYGSYRKPTIVVTYDDDRWNPVYIYDYRINGSRFSGYMDDGTNRDIQFDLYYDNEYGFKYYDNGYSDGYWSSRTRSSDTDSVKVMDNGTSIRSGIFAEVDPK